MAELAQKKYLSAAGLTAFWNKAKDYINAEDGKTVTAIDTKINGLTLAYADKKIALKRNGTTLSEFDASDFIKDSFVQSGAIVEKEVGGVKKQTLRLTLITVERPGETGTTQTFDIDVDKLFSQNAADIKMANGKTVEKALSDVIAESGKNKTDITTLNGKVTSLEESQITFGSRMGNIEAAYKAADTALGGRIDGVVTDYQAADTAVYDAITAIPTEYINSLFA